MSDRNPTSLERMISPLQLWLLSMGLILYGLYLCWEFQLLDRLIADDPSRISWVILALFALANLYLGWLALGLHREWQTLHRSLTDNTMDKSLLVLQVQQLQHQNSGNLPGQNNELSAAIHKLVSGRLESGWFVADLLFKLGLIGTVVGFIYMLSAVTDIKSMDITMARQMLTDMSGGMRLALYTTLAGLTTGSIIGLQVHILERWSQALESRIFFHLNFKQ